MLLIKKYTIAVVVLCHAWGQCAMAANWEWGSNFGLSADWNDNPALVVSDRNPESTFRLLAIYTGEFVRLSPNSTLNFKPRITRDYYTKKAQEDLNSTDFFLPGNYRYSRPRTTWVLGYNLSRQSVLSDEQTIESGGFTQLNADDTVYRASLTPGMSWIISERDQVFLSLALNGVDYTLPNTSRADSIGGGLNGSYSRSLTQRQTLGFTASYLLYESTNDGLLYRLGNPPSVFEVDIENNSNSTSFTLDYGFKPSITSSFNIKFGLQNSEVENTTTFTSTGDPFPIGNATTPFESTTYSVAYNKTLEQGSYTINLTRGVSPSANGQPQDRYQLLFTGDTKLTEKLTGTWILSASQQESIVIAATDGELNRKNRNYNADLRLNWAFTRKWNIGATYAFRYANRDAGINTDATQARSNQVSVGVTYLWKTIRKN